MDFFLKGFFVSAGLIIAIGAQNAFVIKQGLLKNNIFWVSSICFLCDAALMSLGIMGIGSMLSANRIAMILLALCGTLFLAWYGLTAFISASQQNLLWI